MTRIDHCRDCEAEVFWLAHTTTKRRAPINAEPQPGGNIEVDLEAGTYALVPKDRQLGRLYTSHFMSCPAAGRRRGTGSAGAMRRKPPQN